MNCEFDYCIYNKDRACILGRISIGPGGVCEACEVVTVPEKIIEKYKSERLANISKAWENYGG